MHHGTPIAQEKLKESNDSHLKLRPLSQPRRPAKASPPAQASRASAIRSQQIETGAMSTLWRSDPARSAKSSSKSSSESSSMVAWSLKSRRGMPWPPRSANTSPCCPPWNDRGCSRCCSHLRTWRSCRYYQRSKFAGQ
jgi:hypothetical protein